MDSTLVASVALNWAVLFLGCLFEISNMQVLRSFSLLAHLIMLKLQLNTLLCLMLFLLKFRGKLIGTGVDYVLPVPARIIRCEWLLLLQCIEVTWNRYLMLVTLVNPTRVLSSMLAKSMSLSEGPTLFSLLLDMLVEPVPGLVMVPAIRSTQAHLHTSVVPLIPLTRVRMKRLIRFALLSLVLVLSLTRAIARL